MAKALIIALHSTMFLLKPGISTAVWRVNYTLHSTMFLLKRKVRFRLKYRYLLYIPQCFY